MLSPVDTSTLIQFLRNKATQLRIDSILSTTEAGSGHATSSCSAADIMAALFFEVMRYNPKDPKNPASDKFVLSKGHAAPVLYAAWAEAGLFPREELLKLRRLDSNLEGHPTPRLPFVNVPTGSLGQGLPAGLGMALKAKMDKEPFKTYVLMGDGESAEGSVWEAVEMASYYHLDNLCAIIDTNRLGQSQHTMLQHDMAAYERRWAGFGWNVIPVDGHDISALLAAFDRFQKNQGSPTVILAKTLKGKGISFAEDKDGWHGKALKKEEADQAVAELKKQFIPDENFTWQPKKPAPTAKAPAVKGPMPAPGFSKNKPVATREAFADALTAIGQVNPLVVVVDGDVKNSTYTEKFEKKFPERFFEGFIAEQNAVGCAIGMAACGKIAFFSTFACFLTRAADFLRMAAIGRANIKIVGTHAGVSIGEDGASQMGLEDLAMARTLPESVVLYPSDAPSAYAAVRLATDHKGLCYIRTSRPATPIFYDNTETFAIGKCKVARQSDSDKITVVAAGVTFFEALKACEELLKEGIMVRLIDIFSVKPIDAETLIRSGKATNNRILVVEDHYEEGGIGEAVLSAVSSAGIRVEKIAVHEIPHSGKPQELLDKYGLSAPHIKEACKRLI